ncbi:MAG: hypothetical protein ACHQM6_08490 [Candidatus Kapaibacterium sp.]
MNSTDDSNVFTLPMPSKGSYLLFFLGTSLVLIAAQLFVYFQLRRLIRKDFPRRAKRVIPLLRWIFLAMNLPLVFLFFRRDIHADIPTLTNILLYPFTVWEFLMLLWAAILIPVVIIRLLKNRLFRNNNLSRT